MDHEIQTDLKMVAIIILIILGLIGDAIQQVTIEKLHTRIQELEHLNGEGTTEWITIKY